MFSAPNQRVPLTAFVSTLALFVFSGEVFADAINNPYHQMKRQQQLQQESNSYGLMWEENVRQELEAEIKQRKLLKIITTDLIKSILLLDALPRLSVISKGIRKE